MFSWVSRNLQRVYGEEWVTEAKKRYREDVEVAKQWLVWGKSRPKMLGGV